MQDAWQKVIRLHPVVQDIAKHSRGMFSRCFAEAAAEFALTGRPPILADLLDKAFDAVSVKAQKAKGFMEEEHGKDAQLIAISYTNAVSGTSDIGLPVAGDEAGAAADGQPPRKKIKVRAKSMHLHFANLMDERSTDVQLSGGKLYRAEWGRWIPNCRFPTIEEDLLLYLAVLSGKDFSGYHDHIHQRAHSTFGIFKHCFGGEGNQPHGNPNAPSNDFNKFENMVAHTIFCASRRNSVRGIAFDDFFSGLLGEFQDELFREKRMIVGGSEIVASALLEGYAALQQKFASTMIPFLAPPNAEWPTWLIDAGGECKFGHLVRAENQEILGSYVKTPHDDDPLFVLRMQTLEG